MALSYCAAVRRGMDPGIIRNRRKINAAIENARRRQALGSFRSFLDSHAPRNRAAWTRLCQQTFVFTGGETVNEFPMSAQAASARHPRRAEASPLCAGLKKPTGRAGTAPPPGRSESVGRGLLIKTPAICPAPTTRTARSTTPSTI